MTIKKPTVELLDEPASGEQAKIGLAEQIKADATRIEYEVDAVGRRIGVRKLNLLNHYRLAKLLGQNSGNPGAMNDAMMASSVVEIDGDQVPKPGTELQLEAILQRLDFHGLVAVSKAMGRFMPIVDITEDEIKN